MILLILLMSK